MAVNPSPFGPKPQIELSSGVPAVGNKLFFYVAGSVNTKQNTYTSSTGLSANTNPIILDSLGMPTSTEIWFTAGQSYKVVYAPSTDTDPPTSPIWTIDNLSGINDVTASFDEWKAGPTPTYVSATSFTLVGDQTSTFTKSRRVKTTNTAGTAYSTITNSVFGAVTTVTVANDVGGNTLDAGLSAVSYSLISAVNPSIDADMVDRKGTAVASAATTNIWAIVGNYVHVTGNTGPITDFGTAPYAGAERVVIFDSNPSITYNATTLQIPGAANLQINANDRIRVRADTTANSIITDVERADGAAVIDGIDLCEGRLTLTTAVPVTTADVTAAGTLFFTPYKGNRIALYDGNGRWVVRTFSEISIAVPAATSQMYDVWAFDSGGAATLELLAWTNDTTRATALTTQNGVLVKTGATTRRYLGSMRSTTVASQTEDSLGNRFVWNYYNRVLRVTKKSFTANRSTAGGFTEINTEIRNNFILGVLEDAVIGFIHGTGINGTASDGIQTTIGLDSTSVAQDCVQELDMSAGGTAIGPIAIEHAMYPAVGFHFATLLGAAITGGTAFWHGAASGSNRCHLKLNIMG